MNIAVNTRLLQKGKLEGIGWFSCETLKRITQNHPEHKFFFIFDRQYDDEFIFSENVIPIIAGPPTRHPVLWYLWFEFVIPRVLKKINADIFVSPDGYMSLRSKLPAVSVIHDINFFHNPNQLPFITAKYYNRYFPKFARKAIRLGTVSEYSKQDIAKNFNVSPDKIDVCYNGSNSLYTPVSEEMKRKVKNNYSNSCDYFLFVGAINPRKNVPGLLQSFDIFKEKSRLPHKLLIVGEAMHLTGEVDTCLKEMKYRDDVIFCGRQSVENLHLILASAEALVFIPFFEGFGIPLVEAMYAETAIICSDRTSVPEVAGDAALKTSPDNHIQVAKFMERIATDKNLRDSLIEKGRIQRQKFSWDKSAEKLWNCIEKAIKQTNA